MAILPFNALEEVIRVRRGSEMSGKMVGFVRRNIKTNRRRPRGIVRLIVGRRLFFHDFYGFKFDAFLFLLPHFTESAGEGSGNYTRVSC